MTPRIKKAIDIFLDAINEGTLAPGTCRACAVGNLVAHEMGIKPIIEPTFNQDGTLAENAHWMSILPKGLLSGFPDLKKAKMQCDSTGFSVKELAEIEDAFEGNTYINYKMYEEVTPYQIRRDQIRGLEAVVRVMLRFDDCKESVEEVFTDKAQLIPIH